VRTIAGEGVADCLLPGLAIDATVPPTTAEVASALHGADLVVVENLCSLPLNLGALHVVAEVLAGRRTILHHHDLPWQRPRFAAMAGVPPTDPTWRHVVINQLSRRDLTARGIEAVVIRNGFDVDQPAGDRRQMRRRLGVGDHDRLFLHPVRAIARKNVPAAIELADALDATYWLLGPVEEDYGPELSRILASAACPTIHGGAPEGVADAYAAADAVLFPSTWEGFGNPLIESAIHRRPLAAGDYPVAREVAALGFRWFPTDDPRPLANFLDRPDGELLEHNHRLAREHFSLDQMQEAIARLLNEAGWRS